MLATSASGGKPVEDHVFIEWPTIRTVLSPDGWKLALSTDDKCQLFNLTKDPGETTNLYDSGKHTDVIKRLTKKIHISSPNTRGVGFKKVVSGNP